MFYREQMLHCAECFLYYREQILHYAGILFIIGNIHRTTGINFCTVWNIFCTTENDFRIMGKIFWHSRDSLVYAAENTFCTMGEHL